MEDFHKAIKINNRHYFIKVCHYLSEYLLNELAVLYEEPQVSEIDDGAQRGQNFTQKLKLKNKK